MSSNRTFSGGRSGAGGGTGSASVIVTPNTGLSGNGTSVNPLAGVPASALVPGTMSVADFVKLATVPVGNSILMEFETPEIDFLAAAPQTIPFLNAVIPGKVFATVVNANHHRIRYTAITGAPAIQAAGTWGNNVGAVDNYLTPASPITFGTGITAGVGAMQSTLGQLGVLVPLDLSNGLAVRVTTAASGGTVTVLRGKIYVAGFLITP